MRKITIILIGFIVLSNVYYALASNEEDYYGGCTKNSYSNMEPSFSLVTLNKNPTLNKGDTLEFEVYISGYGHLANLTKIYASLPIGLVDDNTTYGSAYYLGFNNTGELIKFNFSLNTPNAFYIYFSSYYYNQLYKSNSNCYTILTFTEMNYPISDKMVAPILINVNTSKNAPEGDNKINLILTYSDGTKWFQDKQEVRFHINSFWEEHDNLDNIRKAIVAAIAVAVASFIWTYISIKVKSFFNNN